MKQEFKNFFNKIIIDLLFSFFDIAVLNVAAGKAPMQISTDGPGIPQKAIDGSTSSFYSTDTCSLTKSERVPWWYVNLLEPYMVQLVRLDFGKSCCGKSMTKSLYFFVSSSTKEKTFYDHMRAFKDDVYDGINFKMDIEIIIFCGYLCMHK